MEQRIKERKACVKGVVSWRNCRLAIVIKWVGAALRLRFWTRIVRSALHNLSALHTAMLNIVHYCVIICSSLSS